MQHAQPVAAGPACRLHACQQLRIDQRCGAGGPEVAVRERVSGIKRQGARASQFHDEIMAAGEELLGVDGAMHAVNLPRIP